MSEIEQASAGASSRPLPSPEEEAEHLSEWIKRTRREIREARDQCLHGRVSVLSNMLSQAHETLARLRAAMAIRGKV